MNQDNQTYNNIMVEAKSICKYFDNLKAVNNLNLVVKKGEIWGLIGPNGAGKSTTMKMLVGLLDSDEGSVFIAGEQLNKENIEQRRLMGYLPDYFSLYEELKVWEYLDFFADAYNVKEKNSKINYTLKMNDLEKKKNDFIGNLSRGMKQRLAIGKSFLHDPEIIILDEPASGLDPKARIELRETLKKYAQEGKAIIISSHILMELADICTHVCIIEKGNVIDSGSIDSILAKLHDYKIVNIEVLGEMQRAADVIKTFPSVDNVEIKQNNITFHFAGKSEELPAVHKLLVENDIGVISFNIQKGNLEEIFLNMYSQEVN